MENQQESEKEIPHDFQCCVCWELLYKPVVLPCGHISCFWCVFRAMSWQSHCPMCRHPYNHLPNICQLLNSVLLQLYPIAYKRREQLIKEEEQRSERFSPQFDNHLSTSKQGKELNILDGVPPYSLTSSVDSLSLGSCSNANEKPSSVEGHLESIDLSSKDLICAVCEKLLYRPVVLNCGHVYCEACIISPDNVNPKCRVCGCAHPSEYLKVCLVLEQFLEKQFCEQYAARKKDVVKQVGIKNGSQSCSSTSMTKATQLSSQSSNGHLQGVKVHNGIGCDYCGMFPIVGERYKCIDCREKAGFDLCESCYNSPPKIQGRFNQQHKPDHRLEIVRPVRFILTLEHDDDDDDDDDDTESDDDYFMGGTSPDLINGQYVF